jgi:hypothetical protein
VCCFVSAHSFLLYWHPFLKYVYEIFLLSVCLWVPPTPLLTFECPNRSLWNFVCISWHLSPYQRRTSSIPAISLCVSLLSLLGKSSVTYIRPFVARQRLGKHVPTATNICNNRRIVERMCLWVCLCISLSLLGNDSVETFPRQWIIVGGIVFYAVRVVSYESKRLVLPRTSCLTTMYQSHRLCTVRQADFWIT